MKLGVLADIHSNIYALDAVLDDLATRAVDLVVDLGDIVYGPIAPKATFDRLAALDRIVVRGNQDRFVADATAQQIADHPTLRFVHESLAAADLLSLRQLPFDHTIDADGDSIYLCHGSPTSDLEYLVESIDDGYARVADDAEIQRRLDGRAADLILCGHTHVPRHVMLSTGQCVINPGSVGLPAYDDDQPRPHVMETFSPHARYAVVEQRADGWRVDHIQVPYEHAAAAADCRLRGCEDWAHAISTGRAR